MTPHTDEKSTEPVVAEAPLINPVEPQHNHNDDNVPTETVREPTTLQPAEEEEHSNTSRMGMQRPDSMLLTTLQFN